MSDNDRLPEFNSGIAYLYRIDSIIKTMHEASVGDNLIIYYRACCRLYGEIRPRMSKDVKVQMDLKRKSAGLVEMPPPIPLNIREVLDDFFDELMQTTHDMGLIMRNVDSKTYGAGDV